MNQGTKMGGGKVVGTVLTSDSRFRLDHRPSSYPNVGISSPYRWDPSSDLGSVPKSDPV